jgi:hypothetical protein
MFVCYGVQESRGATDGGEGSCIEDGLVEGTTEASIKGSMRKKDGGGKDVWFSGYCLLTTWLVVEILRCASNLAE